MVDTKTIAKIFKVENPITSTFSNVQHSAGILDDFAVRKDVATQSGTVEKVPVNDNDIVNKTYVDSVVGSGGLVPGTDHLLGFDLSLTDGDINRETLLTNSTLTMDGGLLVCLDGLVLHDTQYSITHNAVNSVVRFILPVWDAQLITIQYFC